MQSFWSWLYPWTYFHRSHRARLKLGLTAPSLKLGWLHVLWRSCVLLFGSQTFWNLCSPLVTPHHPTLSHGNRYKLSDEARCSAFLLGWNHLPVCCFLAQRCCESGHRLSPWSCSFLRKYMWDDVHFFPWHQAYLLPADNMLAKSLSLPGFYWMVTNSKLTLYLIQLQSWGSLGQRG